MNVKLCGLTGDQKKADALRRQSIDRHGVLCIAQGELVIGADNVVDADFEEVEDDRKKSA